MEQLEKFSKKKSLIVTGLKVETNDYKKLKEEMENFRAQELQIQIKLRSAKKIGETVCAIETEALTDKMEILNKKRKLKQHKDRIYINNDWTSKEKEIQKEITKIAKDERSKGKQTKIGYKKLIVNGKI
ncbi:uncharacterized protein LOC126882343 [Diabrotica virgifera virgifera]|uniref:Uncharacterized protein n=1 Tax=Diabrotica virgifera virgifera TaxID=50390 RepID=A0ABM5JZ27_DIAVI|nr:uncharacterized protein LOC126882343 [Diabrotica virgifera virgifera]